MNKAELVKTVATETGVAGTDVEKVFKSLGQTILSELKAGNPFVLNDIGIYKPQHSKARVSTKPGSKTGEKINIPAKIRVSYKSPKSWKDALNA